VRLEDTLVRLARALRRHRVDMVTVPLGLLPGDHSLTREAALRLPRARECQCLLYDDSLPAGSPPDLEARLARLPVEPFRSTGRDLGSTLGSPERYWRLA
jgi:hypothetical protein